MASPAQNLNNENRGVKCMKHDKHIHPAGRKELNMSIKPRTAIRNGIWGMALLVFALLTIPVVTSYAQCSSSLTNYWKLDESSGSSTFIDSVGGANALCTPPGCPILLPTLHINNALLFDGTNGLNVPPQASFNWGMTDSFSIEFWMKTDPGSTCAGNHVIVGRDDRQQLYNGGLVVRRAGRLLSICIPTGELAVVFLEQKP